MTGERRRGQNALVGWVVLLGLAAALLSPAVAAPTIQASVVDSGEFGGVLPGPAKAIHRWVTRTEREFVHLGTLLQEIGALWLWIGMSIAGFLTVTSFSSVVDRRMWSLRRQGPGVLGRYLGHGIRTFFRILWDRRTPYLARAVLAAALLYWLLPLDLIEDSSFLPGFLDDLVIAVLAAKGFMYLCPDALVAAHAAAVAGRA